MASAVRVALSNVVFGAGVFADGADADAAGASLDASLGAPESQPIPMNTRDINKVFFINVQFLGTLRVMSGEKRTRIARIQQPSIHSDSTNHDSRVGFIRC